MSVPTQLNHMFLNPTKFISAMELLYNSQILSLYVFMEIWKTVSSK